MQSKAGETELRTPKMWFRALIDAILGATERFVCPQVHQLTILNTNEDQYEYLVCIPILSHLGRQLAPGGR